MKNREDVIKGLECCIKFPNEYGDCMGGDCPYGPRNECHKEMLCDALALLKAQEPRVMTLEECQGTDYCWYESRTANVCVLCSAAMYYRTAGKPKTVFQQIGTEILGFQYDETYGKDWRCWNKEPSIEQRKAAAWQKQ